MSKRRSQRAHLGVEVLEDRTVPSVVTYTGLGADSTSWNDPDNWSTSAVPGSSDDVVIDSSSPSADLYVDSNVSVNSLLLANGGVTLHLSDNLTTSTLEFDAGVIDGSSALQIDTAFTWTDGLLVGSGATVLGADCATALSLSADKGLGRNVDNYGVVTWSGAGDVQLWGGATFVNHADATVDAQSDASWFNFNGPSYFENAGTLVKSSGSGTTVFNVTGFANAGTVEVQAGTLRLGAGDDSSTGTVSLATNTTLELSSGSFSISGTIDDGEVLVDGATLVVPADSGGDPALTLNRIVLSSGSIDSSGTLEVTQSLSWSGGTISGAGITVIGEDAALTISGNSDHYLEGGHTLMNLGTATWTDDGLVESESGAGTLINVGTLDIQGDGTLSGSGNAVLTISNSGTLTKSDGSGATVFDGAVLNNTGTVEVQAGSLLFSTDGSSSSGAFELSDNTTVEFAADFTLSGAVNGDGTAVLSGGTLTVSSLSVDNFEVNGGTLDNSGMLVVSQTMAWTGGTRGGAGTILISQAAELTISGNDTRNLQDGQTIQNEGSIVWTGDGTVQSTSGTGTIDNEATFDAQGDGTFYASAPNVLVLNNLGTFTKSAGSGTTTFSGAVLNNSGRVAVESGTLAVDDALGGDVTVASGAALTVGGNTYSAASTFAAQGGFVYRTDSEHNNTTQTVATFTDSDGETALAAYSAVIYWGDETSDTATVSYSSGVFTVTGSHEYDEYAQATIAIVITRDGVGDVVVHGWADPHGAPSFSASDPDEVDENSGTTIVLGWASFNSAGVNEQVPTYRVTNVSNPGLFEVLPSVDSFGTLMFTVAPDTFGTSMFTVQVFDGAFINASEPETFVITVNETAAPEAGPLDTIATTIFGLFSSANSSKANVLYALNVDEEDDVGLNAAIQLMIDAGNNNNDFNEAWALYQDAKGYLDVAIGGLLSNANDIIQNGRRAAAGTSDLFTVLGVGADMDELVRYYLGTVSAWLEYSISRLGLVPRNMEGAISSLKDLQKTIGDASWQAGTIYYNRYVQLIGGTYEGEGQSDRLNRIYQTMDPYHRWLTDMAPLTNNWLNAMSTTYIGPMNTALSNNDQSTFHDNVAPYNLASVIAGIMVNSVCTNAAGEITGINAAKAILATDTADGADFRTGAVNFLIDELNRLLGNADPDDDVDWTLQAMLLSAKTAITDIYGAVPNGWTVDKPLAEGARDNLTNALNTLQTQISNIP